MLTAAVWLSEKHTKSWAQPSLIAPDSFVRRAASPPPTWSPEDRDISNNLLGWWEHSITQLSFLRMCCLSLYYDEYIAYCHVFLLFCLPSYAYILSCVLVCPTCPFRVSSFSKSSILALYLRTSPWSCSWAWNMNKKNIHWPPEHDFLRTTALEVCAGIAGGRGFFLLIYLKSLKPNIYGYNLENVSLLNKKHAECASFKFLGWQQLRQAAATEPSPCTLVMLLK